jgi:UDP-N-acetylglucosamine pyrophosphorylase
MQSYLSEILAHVFSTKPEFALEVTDRISTDITGGFLAKYPSSPPPPQLPHQKELNNTNTKGECT